MNIENIKYYGKRTILTGYFGENLACDGCIARGGSQFANISQPIYLTISRLKKEYVKIISSFADNEIVENYCYDCARKEVNKLDKELVDCWEIKNTDKIDSEKCVECGVEKKDFVGAFKKYNGENYCLDCLRWLKFN